MHESSMGDRLRAARLARGLTQQELAYRIDATASTVSKWERGELANPHSDAIIAIAVSLDVSLDWLLRGEGPGPAAEVA